MEYITIKNPPEFITDVEKWSRKTKANGEEMAKKVIEPLLNNDVYLKEQLEELDGNAVKDGEKGTAGGVATLDNNEKLIQHVEYDHVDNVPAPQWGGIENKPGSYPPSFHIHNKSECGLGNVNNTADSDKRVAYAASAGDADTVDGKHASAFAASSHTHSAATQSANGLMSAADKKKLDGIAASANNYSHPTSAGNKHIPAGGSSGQILRWSADGTAAWGADNNTTYSAATQSANGLMSAADKKKLDGIAASANNYSHPSSHAATMISQDSTHRFVTDIEKSTWNGKANASHSHSYLPLSGGTVTGSIKSTNIYPLLTELGNAIVWGESANGCPTITAYSNTGGRQFVFMPDGWNDAEQLKSQIIINSGSNGSGVTAIYGRTDNLYQLGASGNRFKTLYAATGTIQTSDKNFKDDIKEFDAYFVQAFIMGINPVSYKLKDGDSGRTHYGMIAQDVENLMESLGMNSKDFAGFIKSPKEEQFYNPETKESEVKTVEGEYIYALRYEEFISPLIKMVQIQQKEIEELRKRLDKLELLPNLKHSDGG